MPAMCLKHPMQFPEKHRVSARGQLGQRVVAGVLVLMMTLLADAAAPPAVIGGELEALAWEFRFTHAAVSTSPLLGPLQRTMVLMQKYVAEHPSARGDAGMDQTGLCVDECGAVARLEWWGEPRTGIDPEDWPAFRDRNELYPGKFCRLRRALQPLYDACLHLRPSGGGASHWHDHLGHFWRGINTSACVRKPPHDNQAKVQHVCRHDSRYFSAYDELWLDIARPFAAAELRQGDQGELLALQAMAGAPSLDRLLLLLARLTCLSSDILDGPPPATLASQQVLIVGGGPVGLMAAVQARLTGAAEVTVWEKRGHHDRTRDNIVDAAESDRSTPEHPGALALMENVGLLHLGLSGMWVRPRFLRATKQRVSQYAHTPAYQVCT